MRSRPSIRPLVTAALACVIVLGSTAPALADDITGTPGDDTLTGTPGDDIIESGTGDDNVAGQDGDDSIDSGAGNDLVDGGPGNDTIAAGDGDDEIYGGSGNDDIVAGAGDDLIEDTGGDNILLGNEGDDQIYADAGNDDVFGQAGNDILCGGGGTDELWGGEGHDLACAVEDFVSIEAGTPAVVDVVSNDEVLNDESEETLPLRYAIAAMSTGITAVIDAITGELTVTASSVTTDRLERLMYSVCRGSHYTTGEVFIEAFDLTNPDPNPPDEAGYGTPIDTTCPGVQIDPGPATSSSEPTPVLRTASWAPTASTHLPHVGAPSMSSNIAVLGVAFVLIGGLLSGGVRAPRQRRDPH